MATDLRRRATATVLRLRRSRAAALVADLQDACSNDFMDLDDEQRRRLNQSLLHARMALAELDAL